MENYCKGGLFSLRGELCGEFSPQKIIHPIKPLKLSPFAYLFILVYHNFDSPNIDTHIVPPQEEPTPYFPWVGKRFIKVTQTPTHTQFILNLYTCTAYPFPSIYRSVVNSWKCYHHKIKLKGNRHHKDSKVLERPLFSSCGTFTH